MNEGASRRSRLTKIGSVKVSHGHHPHALIRIEGSDLGFDRSQLWRARGGGIDPELTQHLHRNFGGNSRRIGDDLGAAGSDCGKTHGEMADPGALYQLSSQV
jgi:hypothetical protein